MKECRLISKYLNVLQKVLFGEFNFGHKKKAPFSDACVFRIFFF